VSVEYQALHQTAVTKLCITVLSAVVFETDITNVKNTVINDWVS